MRSLSRLPGVLAFLLVAQVSMAQSLADQYTQLIQAEYDDPNGPGAAALVAVNGEITYHQAFGMANLEHGISMEKDMVFEIGSISKQFTAVAILMLMEEGKLTLEDDLTKFLPEYPTGGKSITVHHLLTHTSGIKSYTSMEAWADRWREDLEPQEMVDIFKDEPMDFEPGEAYAYNNSAYFLLGMVIEAASGQTYEEFIESRIFEPLGMDQSLYGSRSEIIPRRAQGYQDDGGYVNAEYLSHTQPYAAGSLMSTVEDLFTWNRAIRNNQLVSAASIEKAFTNYTLNNGDPIDYGYGWMLSGIHGSPTIEHGGGIFGYVTYGLYAPQEDVFVAVFGNSDFRDPSAVAIKMAALAIGKPYLSAKEALSLPTEELERYVGVYDFEDGAERTITLEGNQLYSLRTGSVMLPIHPVGEGRFVFEGDFAAYQFEMKRKKVKAVSFMNRTTSTAGVKTKRPVPESDTVVLTDAQMQRFVGVYQIQPGFEVTITLEDGKLMTQATNQPEFQVFPASDSELFLKVVDARLKFKPTDEALYQEFILHQGGGEIPAVRIK